MSVSLTTIERMLRKIQRNPQTERPLILNLTKSSDRIKLAELFSKNQVLSVSDDYTEQLRELFAINHPGDVYRPGFEESFQKHLKSQLSARPAVEQGNWIYYPWLTTLVHLLPEGEFQRVRTGRNRNLITEKEQKLFYGAVVGIGGLSVGNSVILAIVLQGGAKRIRLADFDRLALSNLNRIRAGVESLGLRKVVMTARQIYALNPYAKVELFAEGLNKKNIEKFFQGPPKLSLVIDEMDNIAMKYLLRQNARKFRLPVIMGADNGDNAVVDIERYDLARNTKMFHGRLGKVSFESLSNLNKFEIGKTISRHIGPENVTERMQQSLLDMSKAIVSWPQLGGAALLNGSALAYCARKIATGQALNSTRALVSLDELLDPGYNTAKAKSRRKKIVEDFKKLFGL